MHRISTVLRTATLNLLLVLSSADADSAYTLRDYDEGIQLGINLIYNLRFDEADAHFEAVISAEPDNPLGYFFRAMVTWWRVLIDLDDRSHDETFYSQLARCVEVCDQRLAEDPLNFDAILFKGGAIGFRGRLRGDREQYLQAARDGLRSLPLLEKSSQLEPHNRDILFGQGIYNYFADVMPQRHAIIRPVMAFLPDGDRQRGLNQLREVAEHGRYARTEAAYFLAQIYRIFERDDRAALPYLQSLYAQYPDNALFHRYAARNLIEVGRWSEGYALYQRYVDRSREGHTGYHVHGRIEALYYLGRYAFFKRRFDESKPHLRAADALLENTDRKRDLAYGALANLYLGMLADLTDDPAEAERRYDRVLSLPSHSDSHDRAKRYMKTPYKANRP